MKIFDTDKIGTLDRLTIAREPVSSIDLMERAASRFVQLFMNEVTPASRIFVFAGHGNNGGDALAVSRLLALQNYSIECFLLHTHTLSADCHANKIRLSAFPQIVFHEIKENISLSQIKKEDVIIDGLFGSGLHTPLTGIFADIVNYMNHSGAKIYSIDIPSGLFGEDNSQNTHDTIVKASKTITFQFPKLAFLLPDSGIYAGDWEIANIGLHPDAVQQTETSYFLTEEADIAPLIRTRSRFSYKNNFGHALLVAGSRGKAGAAVLCAKACLRAGAGLTTVFLPAGCEHIMQTALPEAMTIGDKENAFISGMPDVSPYSVVGIGAGIGTNEATAFALKQLLVQNKKPMALDADALNILSLHKEWLPHIPAHSILTPHVGEFDRLVGKSASAFERLQKARRLAKKLQCIIVLKGTYTAVCTPEQHVYFNPTGNPGMATAGSGDVLTGIITGLLAQNYQPVEAAKIGVYLHGLAADIATAQLSQESMLATDIIDNLGKAYRFIKK
ncbi:MAG: NAD(P)H-hydrate dehydratase [Prevotellaceae bacterium]|jgi:NAD(P)H-hydrate epimerase|nr:NAD(P)H-hydrate dehydratase [Prevotellaceae bacterium]